MDATETTTSRTSPFLNPDASTATVYVPGSRVWKSNAPELLVIPVRSAPVVTLVTVTVAPARLYYNPISYAAPTNYAVNFVLTEGASLDQRMLLFPSVTKAFDGTATAVLSGFNTTALSGLPAGVSLLAGLGATALFDQSAAGTVIGVTYSGYGLTGANAGQYVLAEACCTGGARTTGSITAASGPTPVTTLTPPAFGGGGAPGVTTTPVSALSYVTRSPSGSADWANGILPWESSVTGWDGPFSSTADFAISERGIRMPDTQLASFEAPQTPVVDQPADNVAMPDDEVPARPAVPVYPRKPARN